MIPLTWTTAYNPAADPELSELRQARSRARAAPRSPYAPAHRPGCASIVESSWCDCDPSEVRR